MLKESAGTMDRNALKEELAQHLIHPQSLSKVYFAQPFGVHEVDEKMHPLPSRGVTQRIIRIPGVSALVLSLGDKSSIDSLRDTVAITTSTLGYQQV